MLCIYGYTDMCSPCDETCENRNLNVMNEDNGDDDQTLVAFLNIFYIMFLLWDEYIYPSTIATGGNYLNYR